MRRLARRLARRRRWLDGAAVTEESALAAPADARQLVGWRQLGRLKKLAAAACGVRVGGCDTSLLHVCRCAFQLVVNAASQSLPSAATCVTHSAVWRLV